MPNGICNCIAAPCSGRDPKRGDIARALSQSKSSLNALVGDTDAQMSSDSDLMAMQDALVSASQVF